MALPRYTRRERKPAREHLPKGAYVVKIVEAKIREWPSKDQYIEIAYDIAEGDYAGFYNKQYQEAKQSGENAVWPYDARFNLNIPTDKSKDWEWNRYNEFFTQLEDSNEGFIFDGSNLAALRKKLIGGKFRIKQSKGKNGTVYNNTQLWWTCNVEEVRSGKAAENLPKDSLVSDSGTGSTRTDSKDIDGFVNLPEGDDDEVPFV